MTTSCKSPRTVPVPADFSPCSIARNGSAITSAPVLRRLRWTSGISAASILPSGSRLKNSRASALPVISRRQFHFGGGQRMATRGLLITPATMIAVGGPTVTSLPFFSNGFGEMRIINEVGTSNLNGDVVAGQLGVDNIHAVPEPGARFARGRWTARARCCTAEARIIVSREGSG